VGLKSPIKGDVLVELKLPTKGRCPFRTVLKAESVLKYGIIIIHLRGAVTPNNGRW
jgi:hypothetical protein